MKKRIAAFGALIVAGGSFLLSSCSGAALLNTITPSGNFDKSKNISFGELDRQKLDVYTPEKPKANAPVIVFVYGGSWTEGSKNLYKFVGDAFTGEGYTVVVPDYRLYPETKYPGMIVDVAKAVAWTNKQYPGRPLVLVGHSAGAYNVLKTTIDGSFLAAEGVDVCSTIVGTVGLASPTGAYELKEEPYITIFPGRFLGDEAPVNNVTGKVPALFLGIGAEDTIVGVKNHTDLKAKVEAVGSRAESVVYPDLNHIDVVKVISRYFDGDAQVKSDIFRFIDSLPKTAADACK